MSDGRQVAAVEFDSDTIWVSPSTTGGTALMISFLLKRITSVPGSWLATEDPDDRTVASRPRELAQAYRSRTKEVWNLETGLSANWGAPRRSD